MFTKFIQVIFIVLSIFAVVNAGVNNCIRRTGKVDNLGVKIFYRYYLATNSTKSTLIFQHGVTGSSALFQPQLEYFCKRGYNVLGIDMRGGGFSDKVGPWNTETLSDDIKAVSVSLNITRPFVLLGWSYGAAIAQTYYNRYSSDVLKLVIIDGTCSYQRTPEFPYAIDPNFLRALINSISADYVLQANIAINNRIISDSRRNETAALRAVAIEIALQSPNATAVGQYSAFPLFNNIDRLASIAVPTLIMHGEQDPIFGLPVSQFLRNRIPGSFLQYFAAGHSPFLTDSERFNDVLASWLNNSLYNGVISNDVPSPSEK